MKTLIDIPQTGKALNLKGIGNLVYEDIKVKNLTKGTVLLKIMACGICSSDIERVFKNGTYHFPTVIGHEFSGQIVAVYDDENEYLLGKKASVFPLIPCNECAACKVENYALCNNYNYFGSRCDGGFSEYLVVPVWNLVLFDNLKYEEAALLEPAAVGLHATKKAHFNKGDNVLIIGTGTIGFLIGIFALRMGANVYMAGRRNESLNYAKAYGFIPIMSNENLLNELTNIDITSTFEVVGTNKSINQAFSIPTKEVILVGNPKEDVLLDKKNYWKILRKELNVIGSWNSSFGSNKNDWKDVINLAMNRDIDFQKLITKVYSMDQYEEAFEYVKNKDFKLKTILLPGGSRK